MIKAYLTPVRIAIGIAALLLICVVIWFVTEPGRQHRKAVDAQVGRAMAGSAAASGQDAVQTLDRKSTADADTRAVQQENAHEIEGAKDGGTAVPATAGALRHGLCRYASYAHTPDCVQQARP